MSKGEITVYDNQTLPDGKTVLQVVSIEDLMAGKEYYVRLAEPEGDHADTPFEDYPQAYAHWRNTLRTLGINVPYRPPEIEIGFVQPGAAANPVRTWVEVYYEMHSRLLCAKFASPEATAIRDEYMANPEFQSFATEIFEATEGKNDTINATIRVACKRFMRKEAAEHAEAVRHQLSQVEGFGAF